MAGTEPALVSVPAGPMVMIGNVDAALAVVVLPDAVLAELSPVEAVAGSASRLCCGVTNTGSGIAVVSVGVVDAVVSGVGVVVGVGVVDAVTLGVVDGVVIDVIVGDAVTIGVVFVVVDAVGAGATCTIGAGAGAGAGANTDAGAGAGAAGTINCDCAASVVNVIPEPAGTFTLPKPPFIAP